MKVLLLCLALFGGAFASSEEMSMDMQYQHLLALMIPTEMHRICLTHEAEAVLCSSFDMQMRMQEAIETCISADMDMFANMFGETMRDAEDCAVDNFLNNIFMLKACVMMELGWIMPSDDNPFGEINLNAITTDLMMSPLYQYYMDEDVINTCSNLAMSIDDIDSLAYVVMMMMEMEIDYDMSDNNMMFSAGRSLDRKGSKSGSGSKSKSSSGSSEEAEPLLLTLIDGLPEDVIIMIAQRMSFFGCIEHHYSQGCTNLLHAYVMMGNGGMTMTMTGRK